jgi:hypothetical protein
MNWTLHAGIWVEVLVLEAPDLTDRASGRGARVLERPDGIEVEMVYRNGRVLHFVLRLVRVNRSFLRHRCVWELAPSDGRQQQKYQSPMSTTAWPTQ